MTATKKGFSKKILATAIAAAALGLAVMPAQAVLTLRITDGVGPILIADNSALDTNPLPEIIDVNTALLNAMLGASKFSFVALGANDNILTSTTTSIVRESFQVTVGPGAAGTLTIEVSRDGFLFPSGNPRTLTNGPAATLTETGGGTVASQGFNSGANILFGTQFATPISTFQGGVGPNCSAFAGGVSTCNDLTQFSPIVEGNPYSLSNRQTITSPAGNQGANYQVTDASTKFATPVTVPEPASLALLGMGLAGLGFIRRRKS